MPSDAELRSAPVPTRPNVEALPQPLSRTPIDLEALARGYASQAEAMTQAQGLATGPGLLVFVSLSMPRPTLQRLVDQAARAKARSSSGASPTARCATPSPRCRA
jgi:conjugal transfer pilus assembly protein TrbC